jgi:uncharacterized membrane protein HdeD (DUF308 family)
MTLSIDPDAAGAQLSRGWLIGIGVVLAILGVIALGNVVDATLVTTIIVGWLLVISGVMHLVSIFAGGASLGWRLLQGLLGVLYIAVGIEIVYDPIAGAITLAIVVALMLIIDGIVRIVSAVMDRGGGWGWVLLLGVVNILLGAWLWTGIPVSGLVIGLFIGLQLVFTGIMWIFLGFSSRSATAAA